VYQVDEERYYSHLQMIAHLVSALKTGDGQKNSSASLSQEEFTAVLTQFFPLKDVEYIKKLVQAAVVELKITSDDALLYENLFTEVGFYIFFDSVI